MVPGIVAALLILGSGWLVGLRIYQRYIRPSTRPLPWPAYLPGILLLVVPAGLFVVTLLVLVGPVMVVTVCSRARPVRVAVWLLYPALLGWLGVWFGGWQWYDVAVISGGILVISGSAIWKEDPLVGSSAYPVGGFPETGGDSSDEGKALTSG
jgi:hypothetical protein